jgi:hypothetical protein
MEPSGADEMMAGDHSSSVILVVQIVAKSRFANLFFDFDEL